MSDTEPFGLPAPTPPQGFRVVPPPPVYANVQGEQLTTDWEPPPPRRGTSATFAVVVAVAALLMAAGALLLVHTSHLSPGPAGPAGKTGARGPAGHVHGLTVCVQHDPASGDVSGISAAIHGNCPGTGIPVYLP